MSNPEAMTYDSLVSDIENYAERHDEEFVSQIPRIVMMAENRLALEAKGLGQVNVVGGAFSANNPVLKKPALWRQTKSLFYVSADGRAVYLKPRKYEYCRLYALGEPAGNPEFYADYDYDHFFFAVTPATAFTFELSYYARPEPLSSAVQVNWTTRNAPQLLLYACLLEAQPWLKNLSMLSMWQSQYAQVLASLQKEETGFNHDATEAGQP